VLKETGDGSHDGKACFDPRVVTTSAVVCTLGTTPTIYNYPGLQLKAPSELQTTVVLGDQAHRR